MHGFTSNWSIYISTLDRTVVPGHSSTSGTAHVIIEYCTTEPRYVPLYLITVGTVVSCTVHS